MVSKVRQRKCDVFVVREFVFLFFSLSWKTNVDIYLFSSYLACCICHEKKSSLWLKHSYEEGTKFYMYEMTKLHILGVFGRCM